MSRSSLSYYVYCLLIISSSIFAVEKGSQVAVSIEPAFTFPAADTDNILHSFGWFKYGFSLEDQTTTATFSSVYPVSGELNLHGGTLHLQEDLFCKNYTTISGLGTIIGNDHVFDLAASTNQLPNDMQLFKDTTINFDADLLITSTITFSGNCTLVGNGNSLILGDSGALIIEPGARFELRNVEIEGAKNKNIQCQSDESVLVLSNVRWFNEGNYIFDQGSILFKDQVAFLGTGTIVYESSQTSTIESFSEMRIADGLNFVIGRSLQTGNEPLVFVDSSSSIKLDDCNFLVTSGGMSLTKGSVVYNGSAAIDILSTNTANGVVLGSGEPEDDFTIIFTPGSVLKINSGHFTYNNSSPTKFKSTSTSSHFERGAYSQIYVAKSLQLPEITVKLESVLVPPMIVEPGAVLSYNNTIVRLPEIEFSFKGQQINAYTYLLSGNNELFVTRGVLPLYLSVAGSGNMLRGNGGITGAVLMQNSGTQLKCGINGFIDNLVSLAEGVLTLERDLALSSAGSLMGPGIVDLGSNQLYLAASPYTANTPIEWHGEGGEIKLNGRMNLSAPWVFYGNCKIDAQRNKITLLDGGQIVVADGSSLFIKNADLIGLSDHNVACLSDDARISYNNSRLVLSDDYSFDTGSMQFYNSMSLSGAYTFTYESSQTSTIQADSQLTLSGDLRLYIGRHSVSAKEPLYFVNNTSLIQLSNASFTSNTQGLNLTRGGVVFDRKVHWESISTSFNNGITCGTGVNADDDFTIRFMPGASLMHDEGHFTYNNVDPSKFESSSNSASFVRTLNSNTYFAKSIDLPAITVQLASYNIPPVGVAPGAAVSYNDTRVVLPDAEFILKSNQINPYTYYLNGNDSIFLGKGIFPMYLVVSGSGNEIKGNGGLTGFITLINSGSALTIQLNGFIQNQIILNGGSVKLTNDLNVLVGGGFTGPGIIDGGISAISFSMGTITANTPIEWQGTQATISLEGQLSLSSTWTVRGKVTLDANGNKIIVQSGGEFVIAADSELIIKNAELYGLQDQNIRCVDDSGKLTVINVQSILSDDFTFQKGSVQFLRSNQLSGQYKLLYESTQTSTIRKDAKLVIQDGITLSLGRNEGVEPVAFEDTSSVLKIDDSTLLIKSTGARFTKGIVSASRNVVVEVNSTSFETGLFLGDGTEGGDMKFQLNPGTTARFTKGHVTYDITNPNGISANSQSAELIRGAESKYHLKQNLNLANLTVDVDTLSTLSIISGKTLSYHNGRIHTDYGIFHLTGVRYNDYASLLPGNGLIKMESGILPLATIVQGTGNSISGSGNIAGPVILTDSAAQLISALSGFYTAPITLNGGTIILADRMRLESGIKFVGAGTVLMSGNSIELGKTKLTWDSAISWQGSGASLMLNAPLDLASTWTFSGDCEIKGNNQLLTLAEGGQIIVAPSSQLRLSNIDIQNIANTNIKLMADDSILILDGVYWIQNQGVEFHFENGSFIGKNDVEFSGGGTFIYESTQTSTIAAQSQFKLNAGCTFKYQPADGGKDHFVFEDKSSELQLVSASFCSTATGVNLLNGLITIKEKSTFSSEVTIIDENSTLNEGITLGDGNPDHDCRCKISNGAELQVQHGSLNYNNSTGNDLVMVSDRSVLSMQAGTTLRLYTTVTLGQGIIRFNDGTALERALNVDIDGSIEVLGALAFRNL